MLPNRTTLCWSSSGSFCFVGLSLGLKGSAPTILQSLMSYVTGEAITFYYESLVSCIDTRSCLASNLYLFKSISVSISKISVRVRTKIRTIIMTKTIIIISQPKLKYMQTKSQSPNPVVSLFHK